MALPVPVVGSEPGPTYATDINTCMTLIDAHDHTTGKGVPIIPSGMNISADLTFANNNATSLRSARFQAQSSPLALSTDKGCLYESGVDLYYNDGSGNQIRMTQSGSIAGTSGSISGLVSPAAATYVPGTSAFVWQSAALTPANLDAASIILRNLSASSKGLTLNPPAAMGSNFSITLPSLPVSTKIMSIDNSGNVGAAYDVDNTSLQISANVLSVKDLGITTAKINTAGVTQAKKELRTTGTSVAAGGVAVSTSSSTFSTASASAVDVTNLSVTIVTLGNPVMVMLVSDGAAASNVGPSNNAASSTANGEIYFVRGSTTILDSLMVVQVGSGNTINSQGILTFLDVIAAGTYTYKVQAALNAGQFMNVKNCKLVAYEL